MFSIERKTQQAADETFFISKRGERETFASSFTACCTETCFDYKFLLIFHCSATSRCLIIYLFRFRTDEFLSILSQCLRFRSRCLGHIKSAQRRVVETKAFKYLRDLFSFQALQLNYSQYLRQVTVTTPQDVVDERKSRNRRRCLSVCSSHYCLAFFCSSAPFHASVLL